VVAGDDDQRRRLARRERQRRRLRRRRMLAAALLATLGASVTTILLEEGGGGRQREVTVAPVPARRKGTTRRARPERRFPRSREAVPILVYHVIAAAPPRAPFPGLYVTPGLFAAQMRALRRAGYRGVTMDGVRRAWLGEGPLPKHALVISFDNGYRSQYVQALPVLHRLGWVGVENLQLTGLPPSQGGLTATEVRALIAAGWELDTQGYRHADLVRLDPHQLHREVDQARVLLRRRYHVAVDWFSYPSGHYDETVVAAVRRAGYVGATTVVRGWARPGADRYRLPRLRVLADTSPEALVALIADSRSAPAPAAAYPASP